MYDPARDVYTVTQEPQNTADPETSNRSAKQPPKEKSKREEIYTTGTVSRHLFRMIGEFPASLLRGGP